MKKATKLLKAVWTNLSWIICECHTMDLYIIVTRSNHFWQIHSCHIRWFIDKISVYYCQILWWWDCLCKALKLVSATCTEDLYKHTKSPLRTLFRAVLRSIINTKGRELGDSKIHPITHRFVSFVNNAVGPIKRFAGVIMKDENEYFF